MAVEIKMPQLSDTMYAGKILAWNKKEGETVQRGDILAEVETDKANLEIESFQKGVLLKILIPAQSEAKVGEVIAIIGEAGEAVGASNAKDSAPAKPAASQGEAAAIPEEEKATRAAAEAPPHNGAGDRVKASPLARNIAKQKNIDLSQIQGSGPQGRIVKKDLEEAPTKCGEERSRQESHPSEPTSETSSSARDPQQESARTTRTPLPPPKTESASGLAGKLTAFSKMRETIARRMQESVTEAPHFFVTTSINMGEATRMREALKLRGDYKGISINHLVIKAAAYALEHEPRVNRAVRNGMVFEPDLINIGIITAVEDGLLIPIVREANTLRLKELVFESRAAVERARAGRPSATDLMGGTFSISNMGMFDVENFTAIINPGQGAVLAVSSVTEEPIVERGQIVVGLKMRATLSVDHRVIDGVMAGSFLKFFKEALEVPGLLMA